MGTAMSLRLRTLFSLLAVSSATAFFVKGQHAMRAGISTGASPQLPASWSAEQESKLILWQGGLYNETSQTACCEPGAPQCKVQAQGIAGNYFVDGVGNRTTLTNGQQGIINLYGSVNKQIAAIPAAGGGWNCTAYCPLQNDDFTNPIGIPAKAKDVGSKTVAGKTVEEFTWLDTIFGVIKMDENDAYVDTSS